MPSKHRSRRHQEKDEDAEGASDFGTWKTAAVIGIVFICFAILWPKMFHPMMLFVFGIGGQDEQSERTSTPPFHSPQNGPPVGQAPRERPPHAGPHPGMRMAQPPPATTSSRKGGLNSTLLPIYSIGVICFLLFMLGKIFFKSPKKSNRPYNLRYNSQKDRFAAGDKSGSESSEGEDERQETKHLKKLQARLSETESALHKILEQLSTVQGQIDDDTVFTMREMAQATLDNLQSQTERLEAARDEDESGRDERSSGEDELIDDKRKFVSKPKNRNRIAEAEQISTYIPDLERALADFEKFSENYVTERQRNESKSSTKEESPPPAVSAKSESSTTTNQDSGIPDDTLIHQQESQELCSDFSSENEDENATLIKLMRDRESQEREVCFDQESKELPVLNSMRDRESQEREVSFDQESKESIAQTMNFDSESISSFEAPGVETKKGLRKRRKGNKKAVPE